MIEGFETIKIKRSPKSKITLSVTKHGVNFNKACLEKLSYSKYVMYQVNRKNYLLALVPASESDEGAYSFAKDNEHPNVRLNNREFTKLLSEMVPIEMYTDKPSFRVAGEYNENYNAVIFDFQKAQQISK